MKILPMGADFFFMWNDRQTDGPTDITKLMVTFRNFANALRESGYKA
jgi:hypothetical protein